MNNAERIGDLMFRFMRNELNKVEIKELEAWRKLSAKNEETFRDVMDPKKMQEDLKALDESTKNRQAQMIADAITNGLPEKPKPSTLAIVRRISFRILKIAAILILMLITYMSVAIYRFKHAHKYPVRDSEDQLAAVMNFSDLIDGDGFSRGFLAGFADLEIDEKTNGFLIGTVPDSTRQAKNVYYRLFTSEGNRLQLNYSDGTKIWLNSNATIKYPSFQRTDTLRVFLSGEAYVHIPSGSKHIYQIKISPPVDSTKPSAFIEAVADKTSRSIYAFSNGGDFYLKAYFGKGATTATLISGALRIDSVAGKSITPINLEPGQQAKLDSGNLQILKPEHITDSLSLRNP